MVIESSTNAVYKIKQLFNTGAHLTLQRHNLSMTKLVVMDSYSRKYARGGNLEIQCDQVSDAVGGAQSLDTMHARVKILFQLLDNLITSLFYN